MATGPEAGGDALAAGPSTRSAGHAGWIARRLAVSVVVLVGVSILVFVATQALPSDPAVQILGRSAAPEQLDALREQLGLDRPLVEQYLAWAGDLLRGSLGDSLATREPVAAHVGDRAVNTLALVLLSAVIAIPLALLIGTLTAVRRDRPADHATQLVLLVITAIPEFVIGLLLLILLSTTVLPWLPAVAIIPPGESAFSHPKELVLPVLTLVLTVVPYLARLHRAAMVDVLGSEYVQMARLKGLPERLVIRRHALRNALFPAVQGAALTLVYLTGGIVTIEYLFAYPGLGSALASAVQSRDLPVVQGIVLLFAAAYVVFNLAADVLT
ncbi:MAG: ABC transporter permease, partial [Actinobacteria bacterium]|nr:ABC transporter permease [Actinomycetota bacterium]